MISREMMCTENHDFRNLKFLSLANSQVKTRQRHLVCWWRPCCHCVTWDADRVASTAILPANSRRAGRELSRLGFTIAGLAARRVLSVPIIQVSGRGGRDRTRSTTLQESLRYLQSTRTPMLPPSQAVSARPPIRLLPPIPGNPNQALNLPQNPTSPICSRLCLNEM